MTRDWNAKKIARSNSYLIDKEIQRLTNKYGSDWKKKATSEEISYYNELYESINWGDLD